MPTRLKSLLFASIITSGMAGCGKKEQPPIQTATLEPPTSVVQVTPKEPEQKQPDPKPIEVIVTPSVAKKQPMPTEVLTPKQHFERMLKVLDQTEPERLKKAEKDLDFVDGDSLLAIRQIRSAIDAGNAEKYGDDAIYVTNKHAKYFHRGKVYAMNMSFAEANGADNLVAKLKLTDSSDIIMFKIQFGSSVASKRETVTEAINQASVRGFGSLGEQLRLSLKPYADFIGKLPREAPPPVPPTPEEIAAQKKRELEAEQARLKAKAEADAKAKAEAEERAMKEKKDIETANAKKADLEKKQALFAKLVADKSKIDMEASKLGKSIQSPIERLKKVNEFVAIEWDKACKARGISTTEADDLIKLGRKEKWPN